MMHTINHILYALSDYTRLRIMNLLSKQERCVSEIAKIINESQPKVSRHLAYLKNAGLIDVKANAQWKIYSIRSDIIEKYPFLTALLNDISKIDTFSKDLNVLAGEFNK